jgi:hypothetical protein
MEIRSRHQPFWHYLVVAKTKAIVSRFSTDPNQDNTNIITLRPQPCTRNDQECSTNQELREGPASRDPLREPKLHFNDNVQFVFQSSNFIFSVVQFVLQANGNLVLTGISNPKYRSLVFRNCVRNLRE